MRLLKYKFTEVSLPICTNITHILGSYNEGPAASGWDGRFWDRPYMAQRELTELVRDDLSCPSPCHTVNYQADLSHVPRNRENFKTAFILVIILNLLTELINMNTETRTGNLVSSLSIKTWSRRKSK